MFFTDPLPSVSAVRDTPIRRVIAAAALMHHFPVLATPRGNRIPSRDGSLYPSFIERAVLNRQPILVVVFTRMNLHHITTVDMSFDFRMFLQPLVYLLISSNQPQGLSKMPRSGRRLSIGSASFPRDWFAGTTPALSAPWQPVRVGSPDQHTRTECCGRGVHRARGFDRIGDHLDPALPPQAHLSLRAFRSVRLRSLSLGFATSRVDCSTCVAIPDKPPPPRRRPLPSIPGFVGLGTPHLLSQGPE